MPANNPLIAALAKVANLFYSELAERTRGPQYPHGSERVKSIPDATSINPPVVSEGSGYVDVVIDLKSAPYARAYEYGRETPYTIVPIKAAALTFPKERWPQYQPPPPAPNIFRFPEVTHHRIEARPYLHLAIQKIASQARKILGDSFRALILSDMRDEVI